MFRVWGRIIKNNHLVRDHVACIDAPEMRRTQKVYAALDELCYTFDLSKPIWLKSNQTISSVMPEPVLPKTILLIPLISII